MTQSTRELKSGTSYRKRDRLDRLVCGVRKERNLGKITNSHTLDAMFAGRLTAPPRCIFLKKAVASKTKPTIQPNAIPEGLGRRRFRSRLAMLQAVVAITIVAIGAICP